MSSAKNLLGQLVTRLFIPRFEDDDAPQPIDRLSMAAKSAESQREFEASVAFRAGELESSLEIRQGLLESSVLRGGDAPRKVPQAVIGNLLEQGARVAPDILVEAGPETDSDGGAAMRCAVGPCDGALDGRHGLFREIREGQDSSKLYFEAGPEFDVECRSFQDRAQSGFRCGMVAKGSVTTRLEYPAREIQLGELSSVRVCRQLGSDLAHEFQRLSGEPFIDQGSNSIEARVRRLLLRGR
jgi:hypothetical protein